METFTEPRELVENPHYQDQRRNTLAGLSDDMMDAPILGLIRSFNMLPYCFSLQCCYGHFICTGQMDPHNLNPLPATDTIDTVEYRIAYIYLCVENSDAGRGLLEAMDGITAVDPQNIQFCCSDWYWKRQVNSYALQVEPDRFKDRDTAVLDYGEALRIERTRDEFFLRLGESVQKRQENRSGAGGRRPRSKSR